MALDHKKRKKSFDISKLIIGTIAAGVVYLICYVIDIPLIDNARWLALLLFVKVISFTLMLVGIGILLYLGVNWHLRRSKSFENHIVIKNILISFLVIMIVMALIDEYASNICTGREEHYLETVGYFRDIEMLPSMMFGLHEEEEYTGRLTLKKEQGTHYGLLGHRKKRKPVYYLLSENHKVIGVLSIIDLDDIDIDSNEEYHVIYYPDVNLIKSIEIIPSEPDESDEMPEEVNEWFSESAPIPDKVEIYLEESILPLQTSYTLMVRRPDIPGYDDYNENLMTSEYTQKDYAIYQRMLWWYVTKNGEFYKCLPASEYGKTSTGFLNFEQPGAYTITLAIYYDEYTATYTPISNTLKVNLIEYDTEEQRWVYAVS